MSTEPQSANLLHDYWIMDIQINRKIASCKEIFYPLHDDGIDISILMVNDNSEMIKLLFEKCRGIFVDLPNYDVRMFSIYSVDENIERGGISMKVYFWNYVDNNKQLGISFICEKWRRVNSLLGDSETPPGER